MFRRLEGFVNNGWSSFQEDQTSLATTPLVISAIAVDPIHRDLNKATQGLNRTATQLDRNATIDIYSPANAYYTQLKQLNDQNTQKCLPALTPQDIINKNPSGPLQCGWYYNTSDKTGKAYLSTRNGPIQGLDAPAPAQPYTLFFGNNPGNMLTARGTDLQSAQMQMDIDRCSNMACNQLGSSQYRNCGFCGSRGIPIKNGVPKYPQNIYASCAGGSTNLILTASQCPTIAPPTGNTNSGVTINNEGQPTGIIRRSVPPTIAECTPDENTRFSGPCLQTFLRNAGCTSQGSLSLALNGFTTTTDQNSIATNNPNINTYVNMPAPKFNLNRFTMAPTLQDAQAEAVALATASQSAITNGQPTKQNTLEIDLCKKSGYFLENYNFCSELADGSPRPTAGWDIGCLQEEFLKAGLSKNGTMYPTRYNSAYTYYNTLQTWKNVKDYMKSIFDNMYLGVPIREGFTVRERFTDVASTPFVLQSVNYPTYYITFTSQGAPIKIIESTTPTSFVWKQGPTNNTIQIFLASNQSLCLNVRRMGGILYPDPLPGLYNTFIVRKGKAGGNTVTFESATGKNTFLRHAGFTLYLNGDNGTDLFAKDSSFIARDSVSGAKIFEPFVTSPESGTLPVSFFQPPTIDDGSRTTFPIIKKALEEGRNQILEEPPIPFTVEGMEIYTTSTVNSGDGNMAVITDYRVASSPPNLPNLERNVVLANLTVATSQQITPKLIVYGPVNLFSYTVNSVLTGWGWQSENLIDAQPNTFQPLQVLKPYPKSQTKNMRIALYNKPGTTLLQPFQVLAKQYNIFKSEWVTGGTGAPMYSFPMSPQPTMSIVRDINAPFLRFEVQNDPVLTNNTLFTDVRSSLMFSTTVLGNPLQFQNTGLSILKTPGINGYAQFSGSQLTNIQIDYPIWGYATFVFSITSIPSTTSDQAMNLLHIGNKINGQIGNGFRCVVYGSTNNNITFAIQTLSQTGIVIRSSSVTVPIQVGSWYMLGIQSATVVNNPTVTVYAINPQTQMTSVTGTPVLLDSSMQIKRANHSQQTGPYFQIGDANTSIDFKVAWLHFFDNTIITADPNREIAGYGPKGYLTGLF